MSAERPMWRGKLQDFRESVVLAADNELHAGVRGCAKRPDMLENVGGGGRLAVGTEDNREGYTRDLQRAERTRKRGCTGEGSEAHRKDRARSATSSATLQAARTAYAAASDEGDWLYAPSNGTDSRKTTQAATRRSPPACRIGGARTPWTRQHMQR